MSVLQKFFKDTIIYGLAIVLPRLINFLLVRLHTDVLPNEGYSENTEFYIVAAFFNVVLTYGLETSFFRFFSKQKEKDKVLSTSLISILTTTFVFGIVFFVFRDVISQTLRINTDFYNLLVSITLIDTLVVIPFAYLRVTGRPIKFAALKLVNVLIIVVLNVLFLSVTYGSETLRKLFSVSNPVEYIFIANLAASGFVLLMVLPYMFKTKFIFDKSIFKQLINYGLPIMVAGLAFVVNENLDKWLLPEMESEYINGAYSACYKLAVFMTLFIQAFRMGAEPFFFNHSDKANAKGTYATILKYFTIVGTLGLIVVTVYIDLLRPFFIEKESYLLALDIVPIVLLANLCLGIYHNLSIWYKLTDKTRYGMYISLIGAVITIGFNIVFIPKLGFMACAYATLLAYGLMMFISVALGRKHYPVPYDFKRIVLYLVGGTLISFLSYYQFDRDILIGTVFLCVFVFIVVLLEKNDLKNLLKK
ncbi:polysaccharide biosynthesis protein [Winogradskyella sp. PC-19]|uniref:oligosaccharide flippase family protein n=1 Tax=unclassified Winogradskyella TaxID=2615021 RepID=UPI000B3D068A|nr:MULTISPECIES: oligosaccharide flippase family protein [unclassified Winogradskyella]ARV09651.1 polysaccharide biosynthesis protein [Winogradskyella sp. PC-19]RZN77362.1 MAG: polysaccharide biosynthesis protein [Winogradskyella sp.]